MALFSTCFTKYLATAGYLELYLETYLQGYSKLCYMGGLAEWKLMKGQGNNLMNTNYFLQILSLQLRSV